jgi:putative heme-binding domain-containing protein
MLYRMTKGGSGHMPKIGSERVDDRGVAMMARWIAGMKGTETPPLQAAPVDDARVESALGSTRGALELAVAMHAGDPHDPAARAKVVARGMASTTPAVRDLFTPFVPRGNLLGPRFDRAKLLAMPGDAARGLVVFQSVAQCATCHQGPGVQGRDFGPDLTHIAAKYPTKAQLLENVVDPSKVIAEGYEGWIVETTDGDAVTGIRVSRTEKEVVLRDATGQVVHIPAAQVKGERRQAVSIMPEGLLDNLEPQQAADLLEWLAERK